MSELTERAKQVESWARLCDHHKAADVIRDLLTALEQAPTKRNVEGALFRVYRIGANYDFQHEPMSRAVKEEVARLFPTPDPADAEENS